MQQHDTYHTDDIVQIGDRTGANFEVVMHHDVAYARPHGEVRPIFDIPLMKIKKPIKLIECSQVLADQ